MEDYLKKYKKLKYLQIFNFKVGNGGIGDNIKYFTYLLQQCIKNNHKIKYVKNNIPLEKYLKLKYDFFYINKEKFENIKKNRKKNKYNIKVPKDYYHKNIDEDLEIKPEDIFYFTNEVKLNSKLLLPKIDKYISIHLRLGDKYLETPLKFIQAKKNTRKFNESMINKYIEENISSNNLVFFCDNQKFKNKIKNRFKEIIVTNCKIGHTSLKNTNNKQVLDAITEFYIITNSEKVIAGSESGFSIIGAKFRGIPLINIY